MSIGGGIILMVIGAVLVLAVDIQAPSSIWGLSAAF